MTHIGCLNLDLQSKILLVRPGKIHDYCCMYIPKTIIKDVVMAKCFQ